MPVFRKWLGNDGNGEVGEGDLGGSRLDRFRQQGVGVGLGAMGGLAGVRGAVDFSDCDASLFK